ncbi:MAG: hypothetical protein ACRD35_10090 [Candidatus Acidiferrales bacterium]
MAKKPVRVGLLLLSLAALAACGRSDQAELERLRRENEALRSRPGADSAARPLDTKLAVHFSSDPLQGSLAGLVPGDSLVQVQARFGPESRTRTWSSEGRPITQYEWDLDAGLTLRCNADPSGRLLKVAVAFAHPQAVEIRTLQGLTLGRETYLSIQQRYGPLVLTDLQLWGVQGLYTVAQRVPIGNSRWRLEFAYQLPPGLGAGQLDRIEELVHRQRNPAVLEPYLGNQAPFLVALEEVR